MVGDAAIDEEALERLKIDVAAWKKNLKSERKDWARSPLVIIDGFLLFGDSVREIRDELDIKVLLRSTHDDSKEREREARAGYQTIEGYWVDPPNYFDEIVWPNYIKNHELLFQGSDVQGSGQRDSLREVRYRSCSWDGSEDLGGDLEVRLTWFFFPFES